MISSLIHKRWTCAPDSDSRYFHHYRKFHRIKMYLHNEIRDELKIYNRFIIDYFIQVIVQLKIYIKLFSSTVFLIC